MPLKFYTTDYKPERAIAELQQELVGMGARKISLEYERGEVCGISFTLAVPGGTEQEFVLPSRVDRVRVTLERQGVLKGMGGGGHKVDPGLQARHAAATAWRTLLEWVRLQRAAIDINQVEPAEVMLPYLMLRGAKGQRVTLYEQFRADRALPQGER